MSRRVLLGVNIDHVATLRQARRVAYPDPVEAARLAERGGADGITVHLREDRRHIQDRDVARLRSEISSKLNLEMAPTEEMTAYAVSIRPADVCLVPEKRQELTTEGGLDVVRQSQDLRVVSERLREAGVRVSLFIDPEPDQVAAAAALGVFAVELHTGTFADARGSAVESELERLREAARLGASEGLQVNAGHGLRLDNTLHVARIPEVRELNIGHSIVARAVLVGMEQAVREMRQLIDGAIEGEAR